MADTKPSDAHAPSENAPAASSERGGVLRKWVRFAVWPIGLIGWGAAAWLFYSSLQTDPQPPAEQETAVTTEIPGHRSETESAPAFVPPPADEYDSELAETLPDEELATAETALEPEPIKAILDRVDTALLENSPQKVLTELQGIDLLPNDALRSDLYYRRAIAFEAVGELQSAESVYRALLDGSHAERFVLASKLGLCRTALYDDRPDQAMSLATDQLLSLGVDGLGDQWYGEFLHMLAQSRLALALQPQAENLLHDEYAIRILPRPTPAILLELLQHELPVDSVPAHDEITAVFQQGKTPDTILLRVHQVDKSTHQLVTAVASSCDFDIAWTGSSATVAARHMTSAQTNSMSLASLLDSLLEPLQLCWKVDAQRITIHDNKSMASSDLASARNAAANRSLDEAISAAPDHFYAPYNYLGLGNLAFQSGDYRSASQMYDTLIKRYRHAECVADTWLNLGKCQMLLDDRVAAFKAFLQTADHSVGKRLEAVGYLYAGRILLEDGKTEEAIRPLRRAVPRSESADIRAAASVTLATAYLRANNPHNANSILWQEREHLEQSTYRDSALLVGAIARFDAAIEPTVRQQHGRGLVSALAHVTPEQFFGSHAPLVVGEACERVGMIDQMARIYENALQRKHPPELERHLRFELAEYWDDIGERNRAIQTIEPLLEIKNEAIGRRSRTRLAELLFAAQQYDRCREVCLWLLEHPGNDAERRQSLKLLGRVYQAQNDFQNAARCFEGLVPPKDVQRVPKGTVPTTNNMGLSNTSLLAPLVPRQKSME